MKTIDDIKIMVPYKFGCDQIQKGMSRASPTKVWIYNKYDLSFDMTSVGTLEKGDTFFVLDKPFDVSVERKGSKYLITPIHIIHATKEILGYWLVDTVDICSDYLTNNFIEETDNEPTIT